MNLTRMYASALRGLRPHQSNRHIRQLQALIVLQLFRGLKGKENVTVSTQDLRESVVEWRRKCLETTWQPAPPEAWPTVAYLVYDSSLAIFETRHKAVKSQNTDMFDDVATDSAADDVPTGKRAVYQMRLGYTSLMLQRRQEREWEAVK